MVFIILCATAFAALRLSGGTLSIGGDEATSRRTTPVKQTETQRPSRSGYQSSRGVKEETKTKPAPQRDYADSTKRSSSVPAKQPAKEPKRGSLDDIEATLGLR